jgi:RES domain-containing protein
MTAMTPLPAALNAGDAKLVGWRIDSQRLAASWDSGFGAAKFGGRWNPKGFRAVYCSIDPATCILEVAVHCGFDVLDTQAHVLTSFTIAESTPVRVITPDEIANPAWLQGGPPSAGQQRFGAELLTRHGFVIFASAVSKSSWNLVFTPAELPPKYQLRSQHSLVLDTRLNPGLPMISAS